MSLLIATPMYGGQCSAEYFQSCLALKESLVVSGVEHGWLVTTNESLITRARNNSAARFLETGLERLMFIDADIVFAPEDVQRLWNLDKDVACGAYPMKRKNKGVSAWKDGKLVDLESLEVPCTVDYAGTGFLMIKRKVFEILAKEEDAHEERGKVYNWFPVEVSEGEEWTDRFYYSEDYAFCQNWRDAGGEIYLDPGIKLGHVGRAIY